MPNAFSVNYQLTMTLSNQNRKSPMTTERKTKPHRIVITLFVLVFSFPGFLFTPIIAQGVLEKCGLFFANHACTLKDDARPLLAIVLHVGAWVAFFVMAYGWIAGTKVARRWPLVCVASAVAAISLINLHSREHVGQLAAIFGPSILLAAYLCYYHLFSDPRDWTAGSALVRHVEKRASTDARRLSIFLAATALSSLAIMGTPLLIMMAALDVTTKGGFAGLHSTVLSLMLLATLFSYGIMGISWAQHEHVNRIWPIVCAVSLYTLLFEAIGEGFATHGSAYVLKFVGGLSLMCGPGIGLAAYLCYFNLRRTKNTP